MATGLRRRLHTEDPPIYRLPAVPAANKVVKEFMNRPTTRRDESAFFQVARMLVMMDYSGERLRKGKDVDLIAKN